jgi:hypothetical protein
VEELSKLVLALQDQLSHQKHEMELLRMKLRKEQSQPRANGQPWILLALIFLSEQLITSSIFYQSD